MLCSISGNVPEEPVVAKTSGLLFERRLAVKVIEETGRCPVTNEPLSVDDLVSIKSSKAPKPRPTPATSIPGLLSIFQNEWDATMLEVHQLRTSLNTARQELSFSLYQQDGAQRVVARLRQEQEALRAELEAARREGGAAAAAGGKREAEGGAGGAPAAKKAKGPLAGEVADKLTACSAALSAGRKKRAVSESVATPEDLAALSLSGSFPVHKTNKGGILSLDVSPEGDGVLATAGGDGAVTVYDRAAGRVLASLTGHSKKVLDVKFIGSQGLLASGSADKTVRVWRASDAGYECATVFDSQPGDVVALAAHPTAQFLLSATSDGSWSFFDVAAGAALARVADEGGKAYASAALHPDGLILGTGTGDGAVRIWETRTQKCAASFDGHSGAVASLSFSENGYYMASAADDGVRLWDLRKLKNFRSLTPYEGTSAPATSVSFDSSGLYLGVGGADARVYGVKQDWALLKELNDVPKKGVNAVRFGTDAKTLFVAAADHNLRVFA